MLDTRATVHAPSPSTTSLANEREERSRDSPRENYLDSPGRAGERTLRDSIHEWER